MLQIYNTFTRQKEIFKTIVPNEIKLYVCGITTYDYCHIGHARVLVAFDVITRYLRARNYKVTYVRNITDVDDKILARANENNETYTELTKRFIRYMHEDEQALNILPPDIEPRATAHIDDIINMVSTLVDRGAAYPAPNGDVYFEVIQFEAYGKLANKNMEDLIAGARVEVNDNKRDARDFTLWKAAKAGEVSWDSPWGAGRPGWHIECSAMSTVCLGNSFDIHGGGPDLIFPHHENEIAQSEAATGQKYANVWMHAGAVRVDNEKMSKSLGNFFTIREVLNKYHPEVIRYFIIMSHYRSPINYSEDSLQTARGALERFYLALREFDQVEVKPLSSLDAESRYVTRFIEAMDDDFNTPEALAVLFDLVRDINSQRNNSQHDGDEQAALAIVLKSLGNLLGILQEQPEAFMQSSALGGDGLSSDDIDLLVAERSQAKLDKNYQRADEIRRELTEKGIILEDSRSGTKWRRATIGSKNPSEE